ncbi:DUF4376 domain-containing protein [Sphingomonas sp. ABOLE]|uniref:DUF4376 domain-containing protein n=1 Tax=Sphingomonas sp. ABOLE TaxID=1985878 RepID=UPI000F7DACED|nr:DUF4376 domain-containing protein [Sphingomonas sp. ABOLE]RSV44425.1 DUF4376 domain-containing protein [Sphingomonas sp. ABOLE]
MFILEKLMPNGAQARFHQAARFEVHQDATHAVVNSYHLEDMLLTSWQDTYVIPRELKISTLDDVERILSLPGAPFAGATVVDPAAGDLDTARARAWVSVKAERDKCASGGCETALGRVDSDERSRILIAGAVQMAQIAQAAGQPYSVDWVMADNQPVTHDASAMIALGMAVGEHIAACWERAQALRAEIDAADTVDAVSAINFVSGWPGVAA